MLSISNVYGHGFGVDGVRDLERTGFVIRPQTSRFPGAQLCRFIDFEEGPSLELIEVEDNRSYVDFLPVGMKPYAPGISLLLPDDARMGFPDYESKFASLRPYRQHFNYDGTEKPAKPGWSYLNFSLPLIEETFVWLTQLDLPRPYRPKPAAQVNGVRRMTGLVFDLDARALERFAAVAGSGRSGGTLTVDGVAVWPRDALAQPVPRGMKIFPLVAVVLEAESLNDLPRSLRAGRETAFLSRPAIRLPTNDLSWDLLITEA